MNEFTQNISLIKKSIIEKLVTLTPQTKKTIHERNIRT